MLSPFRYYAGTMTSLSHSLTLQRQGYKLIISLILSFAQGNGLVTTNYLILMHSKALTRLSHTTYLVPMTETVLFPEWRRLNYLVYTT